MTGTLEISPEFTIEDIHKLHYYNTPRTDAEEQIERLRVRHYNGQHAWEQG